jgi:hypothetical protein
MSLEARELASAGDIPESNGIPPRQKRGSARTGLLERIKEATCYKTLRLKESGRRSRTERRLASLTQSGKVELCNLQCIDLTEEPETNLAGVKILIVDDEQDARDLIRNMLEEYNAEIDDARLPRSVIH